MRTLLWFRGKDLRVSDHPALASALAAGEIVPVFVLDPYFFAPARAAELPHRIQFLLGSLQSLAANLKHLGTELLLVSGKSVDVIPRLAARLKVNRIAAQRWTEPFARERDRRVAAAAGVPFELFEGETLATPGTLRTNGGTPFAVYSAFARTFERRVRIPAPLPAPQSLPPIPANLRALVSQLAEPLPTPESLGLSVNPRLPDPGERAAKQRLQCFLENALASYAGDRDRLDLPGTSRLSQDLKFGTLSVRSAYRAASHSVEDAPTTSDGIARFRAELLWREFAYYLLWEHPELLESPFRREFAKFPYRSDEASWLAWVEGKTGYPVVDAASRQLLGEGFVHNRARMISASFLTKHLLIDYRQGEAHYMKYLTDGDWASNNLGWQWSAGCGCDAQPYFRVFNPVTQGRKFDPMGDYVRRWVPELSALPNRYLHAPWEAPESVLKAAGVRLGKEYPRPIVQHELARARFLDLASKTFKKSAPPRTG
ncbi:MAG TPA: deoxyribodipyrimidine photo-lyase [Polyangiaceae bacterium]|nr:deoxyribodipyrimidine photo-lyase [Polyangiaceae bacterium]